MEVQAEEDDQRRDDLIDKAVAAARSLATALDLLDHTAAQRLEIGRSDLRILDALSRHDGALSAGPLASQVGLSRPALSAALTRLEQRGLIQRRMHPSDRRSVIVVISPDAQLRLSGLFTDVRARVRTVLADLSPAELRLMTTVSARLASSIQSVATANAEAP